MLLIHVPVSSAVKKYLQKEFNHLIAETNNNSCIKLSKKQFLGNFIASLLTDDLEIFRIYSKPSDYISFSLSNRYDRHFITPDRVKMLSYHLDQLFKHEFCRFIDLYHSEPFGLPISIAMDMFYKLYDIGEGEYSRDNMRRYYNRFGKKKLQINRAQSCPKKLDYSTLENCRFKRLGTRMIFQRILARK